MLVVPFGVAFVWDPDFGPAYTVLGSGGTNTVKWSVRTTADGAQSGFDWTAGVLELAAAQGQYGPLVPGTVPVGRYTLRARSSDTGIYVSEGLVVLPATVTAADNADAVWDEALSGHVTTGSAGKAQGYLDAAVSGIAAAVWNAATSGLSTVGSIGKWLVDKIDVVLSTRSTYSGADAATDLGTSDCGIAWSAAITDHFKIVNKQAVIKGADGTNTIAYIASGRAAGAPFKVTVDFVNKITTRNQFLMFRCGDASNFWRFGWQTGVGWELQKYVATVMTPLGTANVPMDTGGDRVSVTVASDVINCYVNGRLIFGPITDTALNANTLVGLQASGTASAFKNLTVKAI